MAASTEPIADLVVVGGGIVGLAVAAEALRRDPSLSVELIEKEARVAAHQTGHNTGVIHAGVYYAPGSLKARLCVDGNRLMYEYCEQRGIPHERRGKIIIATRPDELGYLESLYQRGVANEVPGIVRLDRRQLTALEPGVSGLSAVYTPSTAIVSFRAVAESLSRDIVQAGGRVRLNATCLGFDRQRDTVTVRTSAGDRRGRRVVTCCGLHSDRVARTSGASPDPRILPFRGSYAALVPEVAGRLHAAIYPVPRPEIPMFLGVHVTPQISGAVWAGPTATLALSREGYRLRDIQPKDLWESVSYPGFRRLMRHHWRAAVEEARLEFRPSLLAKQLRPMIPWIRPSHFRPHAANGVRAQAMTETGDLVDDFWLDRTLPILHVRNAPSPAATSSLALARYIVDQLDDRAAGREQFPYPTTFHDHNAFPAVDPHAR
jgi:L-2-hydroxyglutarate oxidase